MFKDDNEYQWIPIPRGNKSVWPTPRFGHTMDYYEDKIYLFGGKYYNDGWKYYNQLWMYDIISNKWNKMTTQYTPPNCKGQATVVYNDHIIMFGGLNKNGFNWICYNDIHIYNIKQNKWRLIVCENNPEKRCNASMCLINGKLIVHAGQNVKDIALSDMYYISINDLFNNDYVYKMPKWIQMKHNFSHNVYGHLFINYQRQICTFGGYDKKRYNNEFTIYTDITIYMDKQTFIEMFIQIMIGLLNIPDIIIQLIGNYCDNIYKNVYEINNINPRRSHGGCIVKQNGMDYLFIFGGWGGNINKKYWNDTFLIPIKR